MNIRTSTRAVFCVVLFASSFVVARGPSQHAAEPETVLVSVNNAGTDSGNGNSNAFEPGPAIYIPAISANGRFVAFTSSASDLVANDTNSPFGLELFVRDLKTGTTTMASINNAGSGSGNSLSFAAAMSADGRLVAFVSFASDLVATDTNGKPDVFARSIRK